MDEWLRAVIYVGVFIIHGLITMLFWLVSNSKIDSRQCCNIIGVPKELSRLKTIKYSCILAITEFGADDII